MEKLKKWLIRIGKKDTLEKINISILVTITLLIIVAVIIFGVACIKSIQGIQVPDKIVTLFVVIVIATVFIAIIFIPVSIVYFLSRYIVQIPKEIVLKCKIRYLILSCKSLISRILVIIAIFAYTHVYTYNFESIEGLLIGNALVGILAVIIARKISNRYLKKLYQ